MKDHRKQTAMLRYGSALILIVAAISVLYYRDRVDIESVINSDRHDQLVKSQQTSCCYLNLSAPFGINQVLFNTEYLHAPLFHLFNGVASAFDLIIAI